MKMQRGLTLLMLSLLMGGTGCASRPAAGNAAPEAKPMATSESGADDDSSRILDKVVKCPKNSKNVNGKCTLNVESDE